MKKFLIIFPITIIGVSALLLSGGVAFAASSIEGLVDILNAATSGLTAYFDFLIGVLDLILP